jgi:hypothetical protein
MHEARVVMSPIPGETALAEIPARALTFLRAIATRAAIRDPMAQGGFTAEDHAEGWLLQVFVDTGGFVALLVAEDHRHERAAVFFGDASRER